MNDIIISILIVWAVVGAGTWCYWYIPVDKEAGEALGYGVAWPVLLVIVILKESYRAIVKTLKS